LKQSSSVSHVNQWREHLHYRLKEVVLIALAALCLYLLMALLSYDPSDPGWTHTSRIDQVHNTAGRAGAWLADVLFMALGYFAFVFPVLLAVKTWQIFRKRHLPWEWSGWLFSWRLTGLVLLVISGSVLAYIHFHAVSALPASAGGALGESLGQLSVAALNVQGSTLLFLALFLLGLTVFTDLSWFKVMDFTGKVVLDLLDLVQGGFSRLAGGRRQAPELEAFDEPVSPPVARKSKAREVPVADEDLDDLLDIAPPPRVERAAPRIEMPQPSRSVAETAAPASAPLVAAPAAASVAVPTPPPRKTAPAPAAFSARSTRTNTRSSRWASPATVSGC